MILHDAYRVHKLDLVQFLNKVKFIQIEKFEQFVVDNLTSHLLHQNSCTAVINEYSHTAMPPMLKIPSKVLDEAYVRITVAPYESDLLVLLFPGENATTEMRDMVIAELQMESFSPNGKHSETPEHIAWRSIFDNVAYASPSNSMYSLLLSPITIKNQSLDLTDYMRQNISAYISTLTVDEVLEFCQLTFPSIYRNIDPTKLEEVLNDIKNQL